MNEADFQRQVTDLLEVLGFNWVHFRPARTQHGWRTPVSGPLGKGWPDLIAVKPGRRLAIELKVGRNKLSGEQEETLAALYAAGFETYTWKPDDFDAMVAALKGGKP